MTMDRLLPPDVRPRGAKKEDAPFYGHVFGGAGFCARGCHDAPPVRFLPETDSGDRWIFEAIAMVGVGENFSRSDLLAVLTQPLAPKTTTAILFMASSRMSRSTGVKSMLISAAQTLPKSVKKIPYKNAVTDILRHANKKNRLAENSSCFIRPPFFQRADKTGRRKKKTVRGSQPASGFLAGHFRSRESARDAGERRGREVIAVIQAQLFIELGNDMMFAIDGIGRILPQ